MLSDAGFKVSQQRGNTLKKNLYVGNLSFETSEERLRELFAQYGTVASARLITDRDSGRPRGFGFVEMSTEDEAKAAKAALDSYEENGRQLKVDEARERGQDRQSGRY